MGHRWKAFDLWWIAQIPSMENMDQGHLRCVPWISCFSCDRLCASRHLPPWGRFTHGTVPSLATPSFYPWRVAKVYFFDNADVLAGEGEQFENLVATSLLKRLHFLEDREGYRYELRYLRDKEGREIDFVIIKENRVEELIEAKWSDDKISKSLLYYAERLKPEKATQITAHLRRPYSQGRIRVTDPLSYFRLDFFTRAEAINANS